MTIVALWSLLPELILFSGACGLLMLGVMRGRSAQALLAPITGCVVVGALAATLWLGIPEGSGDVPGLVLSPLTFYARWLTLVIGLLLVLVNWNQAAAGERGEYQSLLLFAMLGVVLTASAADLVVLFFAIELVSMPTYVLVALSRRDVRASEAAVKYFFLGALSAALLAYGFAFLYGSSGTTSLTGIADHFARSSGEAWASGGSLLALPGLLLSLAGLSFKIAAVPFHSYVADVYEGAAAPITAMLGFVPKFAGFLGLIRIMQVFHWQMPTSMMWLLWGIAALTMTCGNVLGLLQSSVKRMLAYSSIAHSGYMLIALLVVPVDGDGPMSQGLAALLFYVAIYGVMNLGAFAALTAFERNGKEIERIDDLAGMGRAQPGAALALAVCVFSLMGFPPTAGFLAKFYVLAGAFSVGDAHPFASPLIWLVVIAVLNSAVGAAYYLRLVAVCWTGGGGPAPAPGRSPRLALSLAGLAMIVLFVAPGPLLTKCRLVMTQSTAAGHARTGVALSDRDRGDPLVATIPAQNHDR